MHDAIKAFFLVFSALFPILDPLSASPIFLALTRTVLPTTRRELSWRVTLNSFALMVDSYFLGSHLLNFFGVSLPAVQVGGGLVVCAFGWTLLMQKDGDRDATPETVQPHDIFHKAFYPLTLPLTIGPGSISVAITVGASATHNYGVHIAIVLAALIAMGVIAASIFLCYRFADWLARVLGETGTTIVIRLSAFLLLCIGVQIVWNGADALLGSVRLQVKQARRFSLSTPFHKYHHVCGEEFLAQTRRERRAYPPRVCKERATTSGPKRTAARRVASLFGSGFVAPRSQPHCGGCSLVASRQNRISTQQTWSYF